MVQRAHLSSAGPRPSVAAVQQSGELPSSMWYSRRRGWWRVYVASAPHGVSGVSFGCWRRLHLVPKMRWCPRFMPPVSAVLAPSDERRPMTPGFHLVIRPRRSDERTVVAGTVVRTSLGAVPEGVDVLVCVVAGRDGTPRRRFCRRMPVLGCGVVFLLVVERRGGALVRVHPGRRRVRCWGRCERPSSFLTIVPVSAGGVVEVWVVPLPCDVVLHRVLLPDWSVRCTPAAVDRVPAGDSRAGRSARRLDLAMVSTSPGGEDPALGASPDVEDLACRPSGAAHTVSQASCEDRRATRSSSSLTDLG